MSDLRTELARIGTLSDLGRPVTPANLRWAATHEALCRSWIFDVLTGLADLLDRHSATEPGQGAPHGEEVDPSDDGVILGTQGGTGDRDQLAEIIAEHREDSTWVDSCLCQDAIPSGGFPDGQYAQHLADLLIAAGWRKP